MAHAPGYDKLLQWTDAPVMPTPGAVGNILQTIASRQGINVVGVDIGGATTDVFSVFDGTFNRTVSANLGHELLDLPTSAPRRACRTSCAGFMWTWTRVILRNRVKNKMIRPTTIPQTLEALIFEQAVAREALRLAYLQHKEFATTLKGVQQQRTVGDTFNQEISGQTIVDNMKLDLLVASGGVLSHAPRMQQTAMMLIDAFEPEGFTTLGQGLHLHDAAPGSARAGSSAGVAGSLRARLFDLPGYVCRREGNGQAGPPVLQVLHPIGRAQRIRHDDVWRHSSFPFGRRPNGNGEN